MKKVFVQLELGKPHDWIEKYLENVGKLEKYGWYWKIFTPNKFENVPPNVEIVDMNADQFNELCEKKLGVNPKLFITEDGIPSMHITDYYVFGGVLFEDYLKDADFWGITNLDVVFGRLDHFVPDDLLAKADIFSDAINEVNGVFCLWKNNEVMNNLFKVIPDWQKVFTISPCPACVTKTGRHTLYATDEIWMSNLLPIFAQEGISIIYPKYFPLHSHDRLEIHQPEAKLTIKDDGSLWELIADIQPTNPKYIFLGREVAYFHFSHTKKWPNIQ